jgi:outer membrane protein TolC
MRRELLVWLLVLGAVASGAEGQRQVTEDEFLSRLSPDHPAVAEAQAGIGRARAERLRRAVVEDPVLGYVSEDVDEAGEETSLSLAWAPPLDGRRGLGVEASEAGVLASESRLEAALLHVRQEMRADFADWAVATRRHEAVSEHLESLEQIVRTIEARAESGEASKLAAARIRLAAAETRNLLGVQQADTARALAGVRVWDPTIDEADRPVAPKLVELQESLTIESRADLVALELDLEGAMLEERRSKRFVPFPELIVGWKEVETPSDEFDGPILGLEWSIPLGERRRGERLEAEARRSEVEGELTMARSKAVADLEGAMSSYARLVETAKGSEAALADANWMIDASFARYRAGEAELIELLDTVRAVLVALMANEEIYERALEAQRQVEMAAGRPLV